MGAVETLKGLLGNDREKELAAAYEQGQQNPAIHPTSPGESAQTMQMLGQTNNSTYELGQLALDPDEDIEQFKTFLRGYRIEPRDNAVTGKIEYQKIVIGQALMNDEGVNAVAGSIRTYLGKTFIMTNYTGGSIDKEGTAKAIQVIRLRAKHAAMNMVAPLTLNRKRWAIDDAARGMIINLYGDLVEASLLRSLDDGERKKYYNTVKQIQHTNQQQNLNDTNKRGSFMSNW